MGIREECEEAALREDAALRTIYGIEHMCDSGYLNDDGISHYHNVQDAIAFEYGLVKDDLGYHRRY